MKLAELAQIIDDLMEQPDAEQIEVKLALQPEYPMEAGVTGAAPVTDTFSGRTYLYIASGKYQDHLSGFARNELEW